MYLEKFRLDGRNAFITGGAGGIGLATAHAFLEAGARVIIADLKEEALQEAAAGLERKGFKAETMVLDVTRPADVEAAALEANARLGLIDVLVANAGIAWPDTGGEEMSDEVWLKVIDVNLNGCFWTCRAFAKPMLQAGRGAIVTTGSMSGVISNKPQRQSHYNASKAAVHHMTRSLAGEWATRGVRVNCVAPTYVNTPMSNVSFKDPAKGPMWMDMTPMRRMVEADEIASANLFLASDASSAMTGAIVLTDAGYTIW